MGGCLWLKDVPRYNFNTWACQVVVKVVRYSCLHKGSTENNYKEFASRILNKTAEMIHDMCSSELPMWERITYWDEMHDVWGIGTYTNLKSLIYLNIRHVTTHTRLNAEPTKSYPLGQ